MSGGTDTATKLQPLIIVCAAAAGLLAGQGPVAGAAGALMVPFLMVLLFLIFLKVDVREIGRSFRNVRFAAASMALNFVWTPVFAVLLGLLFLDDLGLRIGLLMLLVTPCTDWFLVFTGISKGNVPLSTAVLPLNLVLQVVLLPVYLFLFVGISSSFDPVPMLVGTFYILAVPFAAASAVRWAAGRMGRKEGLGSVMERRGDALQLLFLCSAVAAMFASHGGMVADDPMLMVRMLVPLGAFFLANFVLAQLIGRGMGFSRPDTVSLTFTTLARNSPLALAIAVAAFPGDPLIALVLVVGPLIELPVLALASGVLLGMEKRSAPDRA